MVIRGRERDEKEVLPITINTKDSQFHKKSASFSDFSVNFIKDKSDSSFT